MITIYIKKNQFAKNVDEFGNIFNFQFPRYRELEDGTTEPINDYLENGFKEIRLGEQYKDCKYQDFDENLEFSVEKYNARKQKENAQVRIAELKQSLASTDYQAIKYAEGQLSAEEYEPIKIQRQAWRDDINELEASL